MNTSIPYSFNPLCAFRPAGGLSSSSSSVVVTLESTQISACSTMAKGVVSKGTFKQFCLRFADGFTTSLDNWKPELRPGEPVMDACVVPDGTYEVGRARK